MKTIDNSVKNLLFNVLDITGGDRDNTITAMIQDRQEEIKTLTKEIFWLKQLKRSETS